MALSSIQHRPATIWLTELQKAKVEGTMSNKPKITIGDLLERANAYVLDADPNAGEQQLIPTSPRSVDACCRLGIDPIELQYKPLHAFRKPGEDSELCQIRFEHHEELRRERLGALVEERKRLIEEGGGGSVRPAGRVGLPATGDKRRVKSAMLEKEHARLEALKRRQEKDLQQMIQYEAQKKEMFDKQQKKIESMERRAAELQRQKMENDLMWATQQRERELQKKIEEEQLEIQAKLMAADRFKREEEQRRREAEEAIRRKREAFAKEMERRAKTEEARRETERILQQQAEEVRLRRIEMEKRDKERQQRLRAEMEEKMAISLAKRKKAQERISSALESNRNILQQRRDEFAMRERMNEERRKMLEEQRRIAEEKKREDEIRKEQERQAKYALALEREEMRKMDIRFKAEQKEKLLAEINMQRKKENDRRKVEHDLFNNLRLDKVDAMNKMQLYQRQQLLEKIMDENDKTRELLSARQELQDQRKQANMQASLHRYMLNSLMDQLKLKSTDNLNPNMDISSMLSRRPATAST